MAELEIIDAHNHVYQNAEIGIRNQEVLGAKAERQGTVEELLGIMKASGISKSIFVLYLSAGRMFEQRLPDLPTEPVARDKAERELRRMITGRIIRYNDWGIETGQKHPELLPFIGIDAALMDREDIVKELEDKHKKGAKGVKINPGNMGMYLNDPRLWPVYEFCDRTGLPIFTESGAGGKKWIPSTGDPRGRVIYLKYALEEFKNLKVISAHFNHGCPPEDVIELANKYPGFHTELGGLLGHWGEPGQWTIEEGVSWIRKAGVEHVIFGSNYVLNDPAKYVGMLKALPMTSTEIEKIASGNVKTVLGIS